MPIYRKPKTETQAKVISRRKTSNLPILRKNFYKTFEKAGFNEVESAILIPGNIIDFNGERYSFRSSESVEKEMQNQYIHTYSQYPHPVGLFWFGEVFREKKGMFEYLGLTATASQNDQTLELIKSYWQIFKRLALPVTLEISQGASPSERQKYLSDLRYHIENFKISDQNILKNPELVFESGDDKIERCANLAPKHADYLSQQDIKEYEQLKKELSLSEIQFVESDRFPKLGRINFRFFITVGFSQKYVFADGGCTTELASQRFFATKFFTSNIINYLEENNIELQTESRPVYVISVADVADTEVTRLGGLIRSGGYKVFKSTERISLTQHLEKVKELSIKYCIIVGEHEIRTSTYLLKDVQTGRQDTILSENVLQELAIRFDA